MKTKKILATLSSLVLLLSLTSCMSIEVNSKVSKDGKTIKVENVIAFDKSALRDSTSPEETNREPLSLQNICSEFQEVYSSGEGGAHWKETEESCIVKESYKWTYDKNGNVTEVKNSIKTSIDYVKIEKKDNNLAIEIDFQDEILTSEDLDNIESFTFTVKFPAAVTSASQSGIINSSHSEVAWDMKEVFKETGELKVKTEGVIQGLNPLSRIIFWSVIGFCLVAIVIYVFGKRSAKDEDAGSTLAFEDHSLNAALLLNEEFKAKDLKEFEVPPLESEKKNKN